MTVVVPALLAALAVLVLTLPRSAAHRLRPPVPAADRPLVVVLLAAAVAAVSLGPLGALALLAAALAARAAHRRSAAAKATRANAAALPELCRAVAAELRTGVPPAVALARAADDLPPALAEAVRRVAAGAQLGLAPPGAWAGPPGAERLAAVAALWAVASGAGAGLADGLDRLAAALAAEQRRRADVEAQLAGPRASAAVLAGLPAFGLALAAALGAEPLRFLRSPPGLACLVAAAALDAAGVVWVGRITRNAAG